MNMDNHNKFKEMKAAKFSENNSTNSILENNLKPRVIQHYCDPLLFYSMVMDKYKYNTMIRL